MDVEAAARHDPVALLDTARDGDPRAIGLSDGDRLNYDLFRRELEDEVDGHQFKAYLMPMSQRGGVQSLESTAETLRLADVGDYDGWPARMAKVDAVIQPIEKPKSCASAPMPM